MQVIYRAINLTPGKVPAMNVTIRYRASKVKAGAEPGEGARALFVFRDATGRLLDAPNAPLLFTSKAKGWQEASSPVIIPRDASKGILMAGLFEAAGTIDLAEVKAVPLDEAAANALLKNAPGPTPQADSWLANGDFSKAGAEGNWPAGWGKPDPGMSWEKEEGKPFVRMVTQEPGKSVMLYKTVPLKPGAKGIELTIRSRTDGVRHGEHEWFDARTIVHFPGADGKPVANEGGGLDVVFTHKPEPSGWITRVHSYVVPEGAKELQLMCGLFKARAGTVDVAEIRVSPMSDANAQLEQLAGVAYRIWKNDEDAAADRRAGYQIDERLKATGNLVANGGFETIGKDGAAESWGKGSEDGSLTLKEEDGEHFMRLVSSDSQKIRMLYRMVPLKSGSKAIEVKFRYRTADIVNGTELPGDARAIMHFLDGTRVGHLENGKVIEPDPSAIIFSPKAGEWTEVSRRYLVPEGATKLQLMPSLWKVKSGTLDIADFSVAPLIEADADAMVAAHAAAQKKKAERAAIIEKDLARPAITPELKVAGNQILGPGGKPVLLQGLCVDSLQWSYGENILWSIRTAIDDWKANVIRLPVSPEFWFGHAPYQKPGDEEAYRKTVDQVIQLAAGRGAWVALDLHTFGAPTGKHRNFWKDAALRYKNNPAVLFELFNEPHGISWEIWRNGGSLKGPENVSTDVNPAENSEKTGEEVSVGMQALVAAARETGAKNIIIAAGLDWGYDLTGVVGDYALEDPGGNGIVYSSHIYPWKSEWQKNVLDAAAKHPIFVGEVGNLPDYRGFEFIPEPQRHPLEGWGEDIIGMMQKNKLNWTGFSFHPGCGPRAILDWDYTPTPYWGVFVKAALAGKQFEMKNMR